MQPFVCAVDVGTRSARAGLFDVSGRLLGRGEVPIAIRQPRPGEGEHDSGQIWAAVCGAAKAALKEAEVPGEAVRGIAFDATCSLVVRGRDGAGVPVSRDGDDSWDTIAWFDHRALDEADECTATEHGMLAYVGGRMSPEMQIPKLMWLKRRLPDAWTAAAGVYDLSDFLACRAAGADIRSQNTLTCKWSFLPHEDVPWPKDFFAAVGLGQDFADLAGPELRISRIGTDIGGLTSNAAAELGLTTRCRVGAGMVDAYAGALGVLGGLSAGELEGQAALIGGTSSCVMFASATPRHLPAVWGPFFEAALPELWMSEAGQSASGALLDHVIRLRGHEPDLATHARIIARIAELRASEGADFTARLHVLPDFHGNRAPYGDPRALGVVTGLPLDASFDGLCRLYWRTCVAIVLGVRQIVDMLRGFGRTFSALHIAGGHLKNPLLMELYADALDCDVIEPATAEPILLGTAMAAAVAAGLHPDLASAAKSMSRPGRLRQRDAAASYDRDYKVFLAMQRHRAEIESLVGDGNEMAAGRTPRRQSPISRVEHS